MEVSIRRYQGRSIAFVNDTRSALGLLLRAVPDIVPGLQDLPASDPTTIAQAVWETFQAQWAQNGGGLSPEFLEAFARPRWLAPRAVAGRVLLAADFWLALQGRDGRDAAHQAYLDSLVRREKHRQQLQTLLVYLGFTVAEIPSLSDQELSLCAVNALQLPDQTLVPAFGPPFRALDDAVMAAYRAVLPQHRFTPMLSAASQNRYGGVHCSISALP
jgi:hypothetical protein